MNKYLISGAILLLLLVGAGAYLGAKSALPYGAGGFNAAFYSATNTRATASSTWVQVLAANSGRVYASLVNDGANTIYLNLGSTTSTAGYGIRLNANGGSFEINQNNLYTGAITAVTETGTSSLAIVEK